MTTVTVARIQQSVTRRDAMTGGPRPPKVISVWQIDGRGTRRDPWTHSVYAARTQAVADAVGAVRTGGPPVSVVTVSDVSIDPVVVDAAYVDRTDRNRRIEYESLCDAIRLETQRQWAAAVAREEAAFEAALPAAQSLGLSGYGSAYRIDTDDTNVWHHVSGAGFQSEDHLPNYLAAFRSVVAYARNRGWASVTIDGHIRDVARELASDAWCRKWVLGMTAVSGATVRGAATGGSES